MATVRFEDFAAWIGKRVRISDRGEQFEGSFTQIGDALVATNVPDGVSRTWRIELADGGWREINPASWDIREID